VLEYLGLELGIRGDGERAFVELLGRLERREPLEGAGGLIWRREGRLLADNPPLLVDDLDALPPTSVARYLDADAYRRYGTPIPIQTKRGCALGCTYCTYHLMEGRAFRLREPARVVAELERLVEETGNRRVELTDSVFNVPLAHTKAVLAAIARRGLRPELHAMGLNPAAVDEELVDRMVEAGFSSVDVGAEACSEITLAGLGKSYGQEALRRTAGLLHSRGLAIHWFLLVGGPGETPETLRETLGSIDELASPWDLIDVGVGVRVYNGSAIARELQQDPRTRSADAFFSPVAYQPAGASLEALKRLTKEWALERTNCFMYDEDQTVPLRTLRMAAALLGAFAPGQPVWRTFIAHQKLQRLLGVQALRRWWFSVSRAQTSSAGELEIEPTNRVM